MIELPYSIEYKERKYSHRLRIIKEQSETQKKILFGLVRK
jgi:hypothetical protein